MRQFSVGEVVTWIPDMLLRFEAHGDYRIIAAMPDRDGDHMYRIKSPLEEYERVVKEDLLVKSNGYLPEETPTPVSRYSSITLPTLQPAQAKALHSIIVGAGEERGWDLEDLNQERQWPVGRLRIYAIHLAASAVIARIWKRFLSTYRSRNGSRRESP